LDFPAAFSSSTLRSWSSVHLVLFASNSLFPLPTFPLSNLMNCSMSGSQLYFDGRGTGNRTNHCVQVPGRRPGTTSRTTESGPSASQPCGRFFSMVAVDLRRPMLVSAAFQAVIHRRRPAARWGTICRVIGSGIALGPLPSQLQDDGSSLPPMLGPFRCGPVG
jgi:hypothetical protein